ncbi:MAG: hypothetical protein LBH55_03815 [Mycoplasmataceae bacterium]|jgi:protein-S-isoprenylcysteine O-methyltransferase Ste14|nr:hypothetical protein [Mycoplasmataceae bacterium]
MTFNSNTTFANLHQQSGGKLVKFVFTFWDPAKYKRENQYHLGAFISYSLAIIIFVVFTTLIVVFAIYKPSALANLNSSDYNWPTMLGCSIFIFILAGITFKISERKIRKIRNIDQQNGKKSKIQ